MSNDLISRSELRKVVGEKLVDLSIVQQELPDKSLVDTIAYNVGIKDCLQEIDNAPAVEPERSQGEWINGGKDVTGQYFYDEYICNKCFTIRTDKSNFCPNCGVKMENPND